PRAVLRLEGLGGRDGRHPGSAQPRSASLRGARRPWDDPGGGRREQAGARRLPQGARGQPAHAENPGSGEGAEREGRRPGYLIDSSCPALCRASTPLKHKQIKTWMAVTSPRLSGWIFVDEAHGMDSCGFRAFGRVRDTQQEPTPCCTRIAYSTVY